MEDKKIKRQKIYKIIMLVVLVAFITFLITSLSLYTYYSKNFGLTTGTGNNFSNITTKLEKVKNIIDEYYLWSDDVNEKDQENTAIEGYVSGLGDKYTEYIPAEDMAKFTEDITGSFVGIGVYMTADKEKGIVVYYPIPESPAEKAGIKSGDVIIKVDGKEYGYDDFSTIADNIKGQVGTKVKITVLRDGAEKEFEITREKINSNPIVSEMLDNNIGYIIVPSFDSETAENFKTKVQDLEKQGAKSLIIDLRNNGGGILDASTDIADYFLDKDLKIIETKDNHDKHQTTKSKNDPIFNMPVIILANGNTASASEVLIGALKDNNRAKVIGEKTYGKGIIQTIMTLSDGSGMKITTAEYYTPNGTAIHGVGITPDIEVKFPDTITNIYSVKRSEDTQLKKAIEELK